MGALIAKVGDIPSALGVERAALTAAGFEAKLGEAMVIPRNDGPTIVVVGVGQRASVDVNSIRDAAAAFARATSGHANLAILLPVASGTPAAAAQAIVEGVVLARYRYTSLKQRKDQPVALGELTVVSTSTPLDEIERGLARGGVTSRAVELARDLANAPAALLTARRMAEIAESLAKTTGLAVEIFDEEQLSALGCGGLLGVNAGSAEPPRMIKLTYRPAKANPKRGLIAMVAKGIMYDSGGISLKPGDAIHAQMKNDMSGAGAALAAMTALKALDCPHEVIGYLMCTDNMPSGTAMKLGDVLTCAAARPWRSSIPTRKAV